MTFEITLQQSKKYLFLILAFGILARCYGITDHWKNNDHYNFGGAMMTHALKCLRSTPIEVSRGLVITECDTPTPNLYVNYTPFFLYGMWLTTEIFGQGEWAHRLFFLIFSALNILLVFLVAKEAFKDRPRLWVLAAFFQAFFLSPMYFGTHTDPVTEFTTTPMLLSTLMLLRGKTWQAGVWALVAGLTTWIGYFQFVPFVLYAWARRERLSLALTITIISGVICFASMMILRNTWDIWSFVNQKLTDPEYIRPPTLGEKLLLPIQFVRNFFQSHARLLGPLFAGFAMYELLLGRGKVIWSRQFRTMPKEVWAFVLTGLPMLAYLVPGYKYAMVHIHNYIYAIPMWALLCASFSDRLFTQPRITHKKVLSILVLVFVVSYPFGIYQSSLAHDIANSILFVGTGLAFLIYLWRDRLNAKMFCVLLALVALTNFSQVVNYRNEADTEYPFCEKARQEYQATGKPVHTKERSTRTKVFLYCRGIPIIFEGPEQGI